MVEIYNLFLKKRNQNPWSLLLAAHIPLKVIWRSTHPPREEGETKTNILHAWRENAPWKILKQWGSGFWSKLLADRPTWRQNSANGWIYISLFTSVFISTDRPTVHTNPLIRKWSLSKTLFKPEEFEDAGFLFYCQRKKRHSEHEAFLR